ncbi:hypothetical protein CYMTET_4739 [Cymbomonas tetramitiformis]|uniref:Transglycosylase SLT domain-containing protein n=1 Tax=Cymbomonas tetramitiformis TaxID=36881 RepID=A0AAE0H0N0_9CHLO|nr:hypothetical protein CYMTET_4739 [Cymbomonas tetramitiformis]
MPTPLSTQLRLCTPITSSPSKCSNKPIHRQRQVIESEHGRDRSKETWQYRDGNILIKSAAWCLLSVAAWCCPRLSARAATLPQVEAAATLEWGPQDENWQLELDTLRHDAMAAGVSPQTADGALENIHLIPQVLEKTRTQPERLLSAEDYLKRQVTPLRVRSGAEHYIKNRELLRVLQQTYGVPDDVLVATWGVESNYGRYIGDWDTLSALATLAYGLEDAARAAYFKRELVNAIKVLEAASSTALRGSWAGAMGQCQFMPSAVLQYAVDFDGDGHADIWSSTPDALASMANFLKHKGWQEQEPITCKVALKGAIDEAVLGLKAPALPVSEWIEGHNIELAGDRASNACALATTVGANLLAPDGLQGPCYLVFPNFKVLMKYNPSALYALSVTQLAEGVRSAT